MAAAQPDKITAPMAISSADPPPNRANGARSGLFRAFAPEAGAADRVGRRRHGGAELPWRRRLSGGNTMPLTGKIIDISLELDSGNFAMRTPAGFKKDMQFEVEVLKEHDAPGGAGQIVRGVHMRLHAGSHVDAPEHNVRGGTQIHQLPLELFIGDAIVADL